MKSSSVIGDTFDVQALNRINPFSKSTHVKLMKVLNDLESKDFIEVMEIQEQNVFYRFTHPFMRETLY